MKLVMPIVRFLAAICLLLAAVAFGTVDGVRAVEDGGCKSSPNTACATAGGATEFRKCNAGDEGTGCTTCQHSPDDSCYHGSGPHVDDFWDEGPMD